MLALAFILSGCNSTYPVSVNGKTEFAVIGFGNEFTVDTLKVEPSRYLVDTGAAGLAKLGDKGMQMVLDSAAKSNTVHP